MKGIAALFLILLIVALIILMPFLAIWCINTVFLTSFALNSFWQWLAMLLLLGMVGGSKASKSS